MDLYEMLGVEHHATFTEIKKAYRRKSLTCHSDKNSHNREAAAEFCKLSEAIKLLSDDKARAAYDKSIVAKKRVQERSREFNAKRKLKEDSKARSARREEAFKQAKSDEEQMKMEMEKLEKEGEKLFEKEALIQKQQIQKQVQAVDKKKYRPGPAINNEHPAGDFPYWWKRGKRRDAIKRQEEFMAFLYKLSSFKFYKLNSLLFGTETRKRKRRGRNATK